MQQMKKFNQHCTSYSIQMISSVSALKVILEPRMKTKFKDEDNFEVNPLVNAPTAVSKLQLDNYFRN